MSDVVQQFQKMLPTLNTEAELSDSLKVVDEQIAMNSGNIEDMASNPEGWKDQIKQRRQDIAELEEVKRLLNSKLLRLRK
jgi:hypothetical protein